MKAKLAFGMMLLISSMVFAGQALAHCTLVSVDVTYHESTGKTTYVYHYDCDVISIDP